MSWDLPAGTTYDSAVLSHPAVHLTVESGHGPRHGHPMPATLVHGVVTRRFDVTLTGRGQVFGVKFRPGGYAAFLGDEVVGTTDTARALGSSLGPGADELQREILSLATDSDRVEVMGAFLLERLPEPDPRYDQLLAIVADLTADRSLITVEAVAERHDTSVRAVQRLFRRYVGVSPKWVLQRFRLQDAARLIDAGEAPDLAVLAADLGWYDQSHFTRDFGDVVGVPPAAYAAAARG